MAFAHHPISILLKTSKHPKTSILKPPLPPAPSFSSISLPLKPRNLSLLSRSLIPGHKGNYSSPPSAQVEPQEYQASSAADAFTNFQASSAAHHRPEPISLRGHETATVAALAKKYVSDIAVVVIDEQQKESLPQPETQLSTIRWHLSEGAIICGVSVFASLCGSSTAKYL